LLLVIIKQIKTKALAMGIIDNLFLIWTIPIGLISIIPYKIYQNELTKLLFNKQTINQAPQRTMQQPQIFVNKKIGMSIASLAAAIFVFIEICSSADTAHMFIFIILLFGAMAYFHIYKLIIDNDKIIVKNISLFGSECVFNLKDIKSWQIKNNWLIINYQDKKILKRCIYKGSTQQYKEIISLIKPTTDEI
jgi:hypothetical protein